MTPFRTLSLRNRLRLRKRIQLLRLEFVFTIIQSLNSRLHVGSKYFMESRLVPLFQEILYLLDDRV